MAACPPQRCIEQLQQFATQHSRPLNRLRVDITPVGNGTHHFRVTRSIYNLPIRRQYRRIKGGRVTGRSNYIKVEAHGYLVGWADSNSTLVIGDTATDQKTFLINGAFLLWFAVILLTISWWLLADYLFIAPLVLLMLISFAHTTLMQPEILADKHRRALAIQVDRTLRQPITRRHTAPIVGRPLYNSGHRVVNTPNRINPTHQSSDNTRYRPAQNQTEPV